MAYVTLDAKQCLKLETLFLIRTREQDPWSARKQKEPVGCMVKIDLRPFGQRESCFTYDGAEYREANGAEILMVISGRRDVVIWRKR